MRIAPVIIYKNDINFSSKKILTKPLISEVKLTGTPNLSTYMPLMSNKMKINENIKFFLNGLEKINTKNKKENKPIKIADIGCCDGVLCRTLRKYLPSNTKIYGLDLSAEMLDSAKSLDRENGISSIYSVGNAFELPYKNDKMDAILLSSVMHEIYSYANTEFNQPEYSQKSIECFLKEAYESLNSGGVLIIKDPATAQENRFEKVKIYNAATNDGTLAPLKNIDELKNADITKLCTLDKLKRFCMDFKPAKGNVYFNKNEECIMPRWLVTEFVRHRKWLATPENWKYEIKEQYGTITPEEMNKLAKKVGFNVIKAENIFIPNKNNIYAIKENEFEIKDSNDRELNLEDFPMFLEVILSKQ